MKILQICLPHLSDVAILPWEMKKRHFQQSYSDYLRNLHSKSVNFWPRYPKNKKMDIFGDTM